MKNNILLVNTDVNLKGKLEQVAVIHTEKLLCAVAKYESIPREDGLFDFEKHTYKGENTKIENSSGTLCFINNEHKFYGIIKGSKGAIKLLWLTFEDAHADPNFEYVINKANPVDISKLGDLVLEKDWFKANNVKSFIVSSLSARLKSKEKFLEETGLLKLSTDSGRATEILLNEAQLLAEYSRVKELQSELKAQSDRLNEIITKIESDSLREVMDIIIEVDETFTFDEPTMQYAFTQNEYVYESLLKSLQYMDAVSIPRSYFAKLNSCIKKQLESNIAYTWYRVIAQVRFEAKSDYSILAIVDYDEAKDFVRLTILNSFSKHQINDREVAEHYRKYEVWRRKNAISM